MLTARKWVAAGLGGPEVLRNIEADVPDPGPGQVTVGVRACGMNPADAKHIAPGQEASDVSLALVADRRRVVTIAAAPQAQADGYIFVGATNPASGPFRARVRSRILKLAQDGDLVVPMAETFRFDDVPAAFAALTGPHPPGKLALVNER